MPRLTSAVLSPGALSKLGQPVFQLGDLTLRPFTRDDAQALLAAFQDPDIQRWNALTMASWQEAAAMIAMYQRGWQTETAAHWAITDPAVIGRVSIRAIDLETGSGEVSYWVAPNARGRRVAVRATEAVSRWALRDVGLHRLVLHHSVDNPPSCRVAARAGFVCEGTLRSAGLHGDGWHDMHLHALIQEDLAESGVSGAAETDAGGAAAEPGPGRAAEPDLIAKAGANAAESAPGRAAKPAPGPADDSGAA